LRKGFFLVMIAQALSSLADNALLIAAIALIAQLQGPDWMVPLMKWWFALAYVALAAYVGAFADALPKGQVMFITNAIKIAGCLLMFFHDSIGLVADHQLLLIFCAYTLVGVGAAAYSPAKYGIVTEMLPPKLLVKGNSWIEGLTVLSIIIGTVMGGVLIHPTVAATLLSWPAIQWFASSSAEAAIFIISLVYLAAALVNLLIPHTHVEYPKQGFHPIGMIRTFAGYIRILWGDRLGQISLAVTTLFWGAGATLQFIVIEWGAQQLNYRLDQASILMGVAAIGTVVGSILAGRIPLNKALSVLPMGILMGFAVMLMPFIQKGWTVYALLLLIGGLSGYFVVPMNALIQHRGHVLLSAGHSIAVQNFNEQTNIMIMLAVYSLLLWLDLPINLIILLFGGLVAGVMSIIILWNRHNHRTHPGLTALIGQEGHGQALETRR